MVRSRRGEPPRERVHRRRPAHHHLAASGLRLAAGDAQHLEPPLGVLRRHRRALAAADHPRHQRRRGDERQQADGEHQNRDDHLDDREPLFAFHCRTTLPIGLIMTESLFVVTLPVRRATVFDGNPSMLNPRGSYWTESRDALMVTLKRAYKSWTPETVSTFAGHAVVTQTVFAVKCSTPRQPRWIAAARAVPASVPTASRAERRFVLSSVREIFGKPIIAMIPISTTTMTISMVVKPERRMTMPPVVEYPYHTSCHRVSSCITMCYGLQLETDGTAECCISAEYCTSRCRIGPPCKTGSGGSRPAAWPPRGGCPRRPPGRRRWPGAPRVRRPRAMRRLSSTPGLRPGSALTPDARPGSAGNRQAPGPPCR